MHRKILITATALAVAGVPAAAAAERAFSSKAPKAKNYAGKTSKKQPLTFRTTSDGEGVYQFRFRAKAPCPTQRNASLQRYAYSGVMRVTGSTFRSQSGSYVRVTGRFANRGRTASGTVRVRIPFGKDRYCDSKSLKWSARMR